MDVLENGPAPGRRRAVRVSVAVCVAVAVVVAVSAVVLDRDPAWPSGCGVDGHQDWCAAPSGSMTDRSVRDVVHEYCPGLSQARPEAVEPQPLDLVDLAGADAFARTTGEPGSGTEDALLGSPAAFSWVTRWVGGRNDGRVELRCPGRTRTVPALRLERAQFASTVDALDRSGRRIDFSAVARASVPPDTAARNVSFGFFSCDTAAVDLGRLRPGRSFECMVEVYSAQGRGAYRRTFRVGDRPPYFQAVD